ncbi:MAG: hypothetical protein M3083_19970 [Actinomycetota bacterium]|nr:hypothetical protein [Actinomycetota bacterium]
MIYQPFDVTDIEDSTLIELWQQLGFPKVEPPRARLHDWVAVVEVSAGACERHYDLDALEDLLEGLSEWQPSALYNEEGHALQLHVAAATPADALRLALYHHDRVARHIGLTNLSLLRTEIVSFAEFDRSCQSQIETCIAPIPIAAQPFVPNEVYEATRNVLIATTPVELTEIVVGFVLAAGGTVNVGLPAEDAGTVTVAMPIGQRSQLYASAEAESAAAVMVGLWLPRLLDDAARAMARLAVEHPYSRPL